MRDEPRFCHVFGAMAMDKSIFYKHPIGGSLRQPEDTAWILRLRFNAIMITQIPKQILTCWIGHDNLCHNKF